MVALITWAANSRFLTGLLARFGMTKMSVTAPGNELCADRAMSFAQPHKQKASRPTVPCDGPRMNPSVDVGCPPRPFRHLRMAQRRTPDLSSSRAPVHSALVQKSVTVITNPAGRLSIWMLGKTRALGKWKGAKRWQVVCNQSNVRFTNALASDRETKGCSLGKN